MTLMSDSDQLRRIADMLDELEEQSDELEQLEGQIDYLLDENRSLVDLLKSLGIDPSGHLNLGEFLAYRNALAEVH